MSADIQIGSEAKRGAIQGYKRRSNQDEDRRLGADFD